MKQFRHGDVWVEEIQFIPKGLKKKGADKNRLILADGEITGHHHVVPFEDINVAVQDEESIYFETIKETVLTHEEHAPITLEPNKKYRSYIQREYDENAKELSRPIVD